MKQINFEGLGINLEINSVAFDIFGIKIYWYSIFIVLGIIFALILCKRDDGKHNIKFENILELLLFVIPISIVFARLYYVAFKLDYYFKNPIEIFDIRNGGLAIYGGIIGGLITTIIYCKKKKIKILDVLDYLAPYLALGQSIGRWGNFFNGEAHGIETNSLLRMGLVEKRIIYSSTPNIFI